MLQCHIKYGNIWTVSVNNSILFSQISICCFCLLIVSVQVKLIWSKPSSKMLFFCHSYSFYVLNTQTIAKWNKKTCNLGDMYISYWANCTVNRSGVAGNHTVFLGIFICHKKQVPLKDCSQNTDYFYVLLLIYWCEI